MTLKLIKIKFFNLIKYLIYLILDTILSFQKQEKTPKTLLLIKLDSIGDYLLFRNFLKFFKTSDSYRNYKITLLGNIVWKDLAEKFDKESVDNFLWLDRNKFSNNLFYKFQLLNSIYKSGFETVIDCAYSREILFGDSIIKTSRATNRIGSVGSPDNYVKWKRNLLTDKFYTNLISTSDKIIFEFERNREFISKILNYNLDIRKPNLDTNEIDSFDFEEKYIVIFPGANDTKRRWSVEKFSKVIFHIVNNYKFLIVLAGSNSDVKIVEKIFKHFVTNRVKNFVGKTNLPEFAKLIAGAELLITNETSAVHFAASVNTPFVCISNGNHFGRFHPYPEEAGVEGVFIYPKEIKNNLANIDYLKSKYGFGSNLDINLIDENEVISIVDKFLIKD